jgi:hypothetical protein
MLVGLPSLCLCDEPQRGIPLEHLEDASFEKDIGWVSSLEGSASFAQTALGLKAIELVRVDRI